jgi:hypothetical protein
MLDVHDDDDHWCGDAGVQLGIRLISKQFNILTVPSLIMTLNKEGIRKIYTTIILQRSVNCIHIEISSPASARLDPSIPTRRYIRPWSPPKTDHRRSGPRSSCCSGTRRLPHHWCPSASSVCPSGTGRHRRGPLSTGRRRAGAFRWPSSSRWSACWRRSRG